MRLEKVIVTPELAGQMMSKNERNRKIRTGAVGRIDEDIRNGNWVLNGESIKLDKDGYVIDGQHRLAAIVLAGIPVETYVAYDVERSAAMTIDTGIRRTESDVIRISKVCDRIYSDNSSIALSKKLMQLRDGFVFNQQKKYSALDVFDFEMAHKAIIQFAHENCFFTRRKFLRTTSFVVALFYAITCGVPVMVVKDFCSTLFRNSIYSEYNISAALALKDWYMTKGCELRAEARDSEVIRRTKTALYCYYTNKQKTTIDPYEKLDAEYVEKILEEVM